jgi:hypothetical protein
VSAAGRDDGASVAIQVLESESKKDAKAAYRDQRSLVTRPKRVDDVGNAAFYSHDVGDLAVVRKGTTIVSVTLLVFGEELDPHRDDVIALAQAAVANL